MRKRIFTLMLIFALMLTGCTKAPTKDIAGIPWNKDWTNVGSLMGVEPRKDWTLRRNEDVLAAEGMFYYVWVKGDAVTYTNDFDETVTAHQAEIHLVLSESPSAKDAQNVAEQWEQLTQERYPDAQTSEAAYAGQSFSLSTYDTGSSRGASATGLKNEFAIRVDVITLGDEEPETILADFLNVCHYAE